MQSFTPAISAGISQNIEFGIWQNITEVDMQKWSITLFLGIFCFAFLLLSQETQEKLPIPAEQDQAESEKLIQDIFAEDFKNADTPEKKTKLAEYLFDQGKQSTDSPSNRYLLYQHTRKLAAEAGNLALAMTAVEELGRQFELDTFSLKIKTLATAGKSVSSKEANKELATLSLNLISRAIKADDYQNALKLGEVAEQAARKAKVVKLVVSVRNRLIEVKQLKKAFFKIQTFIERAARNPGDAEANMEIGIYFGLQKQNWPKALPYLAKGSDVELKKLALVDLIKPKDGTDQVKLADGWWALAKKYADAKKLNLQARAAYWYNKALPELTGLNRTKAIRRMDQVAGHIQGTPLGTTLVINKQNQKLEGHDDEVKSLAFSPDGRFAVSGSVDKTVRLWDLAKGKEVRVFRGHSKLVWGVDYHPNGNQVVSSSWDSTARLWNVHTGEEERRYSHPIDVNGVALSRDGRKMLVGCDDKFMQLWDVTTGKAGRRFTGPGNFVYGVAFSPNGKLVACGSLDQSARVYDIETGRLVCSLDEHNNAVYIVEFSPDGSYLYTCRDGAAHKWEISTGKELKKYSPGPVSGWITALALSRDGRRLLTGGDDRYVRYWDVATGKELRRFEGHTDRISAVAISPNGRYAISGGMDRTLRLWKLPVQ